MSAPTKSPVRFETSYDKDEIESNLCSSLFVEMRMSHSVFFLLNPSLYPQDSGPSHSRPFNSRITTFDTPVVVYMLAVLLQSWPSL